MKKESLMSRLSFEVPLVLRADQHVYRPVVVAVLVAGTDVAVGDIAGACGVPEALTGGIPADVDHRVDAAFTLPEGDWGVLMQGSDVAAEPFMTVSGEIIVPQMSVYLVKR